jgi:hypothetical protein
MSQASGVRVGVALAGIGVVACEDAVGDAGTSEGGACVGSDGGRAVGGADGSGLYPPARGAGRGSCRTWSRVSLRAGVFAATTAGEAVALGAGVGVRDWERATSISVAGAGISVGRCEAPAIVPW